ncbi:MAG TPA: hypothetical protein VNZ56_04885 [Verrucomicrobiae bacterium]|jgi:hypothetical protein|nr:hypothetical protein [Verrucomicrobiae bacterium]
MRALSSVVKLWGVPVLLVSSALVWASVPANAQSGQLPMEPLHDSGQGVTAAYEGWFKNPDGSYNMLFGYFNRNMKQELDVPIGDGNRIEPGPPDQGQPTHFLPQRQWGIFTVTVPQNFGTQKLTWTIVVNGVATAVPAHLDARWEINPFFDVGVGNTPPLISFEDGGPSVQGPRGFSTALETTLANPLTLNVWVADDAKSFQGGKPPETPPVTVTWSKYRGPGTVTFSNNKPPVEQGPGKWKVTPAPVVTGKATTTASFGEPGEYVLRVVANDWSGDGGGGFQCCWTYAQVKVSVKP